MLSQTLKKSRLNEHNTTKANLSFFLMLKECLTSFSSTNMLFYVKLVVIFYHISLFVHYTVLVIHNKSYLAAVIFLHTSNLFCFFNGWCAHPWFKTLTTPAL